jgi:hypothetical protein
MSHVWKRQAYSPSGYSWARTEWDGSKMKCWTGYEHGWRVARRPDRHSSCRSMGGRRCTLRSWENDIKRLGEFENSLHVVPRSSSISRVVAGIPKASVDEKTIHRLIPLVGISLKGGPKSNPWRSFPLPKDKLTGTSINSEPPKGTAMKTITYVVVIDHLWY